MYALQILMSLMMVTFVFVMIMIAEASTDRIQEVLEEVPEMIDDDSALAEVCPTETSTLNMWISVTPVRAATCP